MKAHIKVIDDHGVTFEGSAELVRTSSAGKPPKAKAATQAARHPTTSLSFSLNTRAFMKKYAKDMNGSRKFTLLLARLTEGKIGKEISVDLVVAEWNKMKPLMGGTYNGAHANRAKEQGWIDSSKKGVYSLSGSWKEMIGAG